MQSDDFVDERTEENSSYILSCIWDFFMLSLARCCFPFTSVQNFPLNCANIYYNNNIPAAISRVAIARRIRYVCARVSKLLFKWMRSLPNSIFKCQSHELYGNSIPWVDTTNGNDIINCWREQRDECLRRVRFTKLPILPWELFALFLFWYTNGNKNGHTNINKKCKWSCPGNSSAFVLFCCS